MIGDAVFFLHSPSIQPNNQQNTILKLKDIKRVSPLQKIDVDGSIVGCNDDLQHLGYVYCTYIYMYIHTHILTEIIYINVYTWDQNLLSKQSERSEFFKSSSTSISTSSTREDRSSVI